MKNNKRPFTPGFINRIDRYLLLNKPDTWSARTHLAVYYALLFIAALALLCYLVPDDPRSSSYVFGWSFLVSVLAAIGLIVWLIYLLRFNVFKRFGIQAAGDKLKTFLLYFLTVAVMVAAIYVPSLVETLRANRAYTSNEIISDVNAINLAVCRLNYDSLPRVWEADTLLVRNTGNANMYDDEGRVRAEGHSADYRIIDTAEFAYRKATADSLLTLNDSVYIAYKCPDYNFVTGHGSSFRAAVEELTPVDIYNRVFRKREIFDKEKTRAQLLLLLKKYTAGNDAAAAVYGYERPDEGAEEYRYRINDNYNLPAVNRSINNITDRKYRWEGLTLTVFLRIFYYVSFCIALMLFIFRHSTVSTFFLSVLAGIILFMLTALFSVMIRIESGAAILICCVFYWLAFLLLALSVYKTRVRRTVTGIGLNLLVFFTAFLPLLLTALYYQLRKDADRREADYVFDFTKYKNEDLHYLYAEILGAVLLLVLIETGFKRLYRRWYALPED